MKDILAYFLTWGTYGAWLPGDKRGWVHHSDGAWHVPVREPSAALERQAFMMLKCPTVILSDRMRDVVDASIAQSCAKMNWRLHARNVRTNHVHVVLTAEDVAPEKVLSHLKAWASRAMNEEQRIKTQWWARHGSTRYIKGEDCLQKAIQYVKNQ